MAILSDIDYRFRRAADGELVIVEDEACLRQLVLATLNTSKGERVMRPEWGADLDGFLGEPVNGDTAMALEVAITQSLGAEGRIVVDAIRVVPDPDNKRWLIHVECSAAGVSGEVDTAFYSDQD